MLLWSDPHFPNGLYFFRLLPAAYCLLFVTCSLHEPPPFTSSLRLSSGVIYLFMDVPHFRNFQYDCLQNFFPKLIKVFCPKRLPEQVFQPFTRIYVLDSFRQFTVYTAKTLGQYLDKHILCLLLDSLLDSLLDAFLSSLFFEYTYQSHNFSFLA